MYPSPLRDGGYDIADFYNVHPDYGTVEDFKRVRRAAHQRGIRVIADLVMNHTSIDHPWFQESRADPTRPSGDWYVWSDTDDRYQDARIIFVDTEASNWTLDPVRGQYYWHRFFSHQPDLNFENPEVQEAMLNVLRFWLDLGIDGFRLDAVPYLFEAEGTSCENLPQTHAYLKRVRAEVDARYPDRVLLAEANQWPADVVQYFGDGDECHMAFHFPVMPRMFMAVRREDATPMYEILGSTPDIPTNCQWGLFLRNHDELTLEMVTDEERDYMYAEYAKDPRMKLNLGIRRRLAPLLDGSRDEIELHARRPLLAARFARPLLRGRDRDGRQRLSRRPRRRADADAVDGRPECGLFPRRLGAALPPAAHGSGLRLPGREHRGPAPFARVVPSLAAPFHRAAEGASCLRARQLRAAAFGQSADIRPHQALGGGRHPLRPQRRPLRPARPARPLGVRGYGPGGDVRPDELPADRGAAVPADTRTEGVLLVPIEAGHMRFDERALIDHVTQQRWYGAKSRDVAHAQVVDSVVLRTADPQFALALAEMRYDTGAHDIYQLLYSLRDGAIEIDGLQDASLARELVSAMRSGLTLHGAEGIVEFRPVEGYVGLGRELKDARDVGAEQSNTSVVFDDELILKVFRRLEPGINPELEMLRFLTEHGFENIAALGGWYSYAGGPLTATLGIVQEYVRGGLDGWDLALDALAEDPDRFLDRLRRLGEVTGEMHSVLGSNPNDAAFSPETPSVESLGLLTATVDEEIARVFLTLPEEEAVAPIAGRGEEVRDQLRQLTYTGAAGQFIRVHGDYHLGQTMWAGDDWVILDFEGEPARSLAERRRKRSVLRDVAGMLRSFAYAASAVSLLRGTDPPEGWEEEARSQFLEGYFETVEPSLLPSGQSAIDRLLAVFELEKAVYELQYELDNRPGWVGIPVREAAWALESLNKIIPAETIDGLDWRWLAEQIERSPENFLAAVSERGRPARVTPKRRAQQADLSRLIQQAGRGKIFPRVVEWTLIDRRRVTPVPPDHWLLIQDTAPFRATLQMKNEECGMRNGNAGAIHVQSIPAGNVPSPASRRVKLRRRSIDFGALRRHVAENFRRDSFSGAHSALRTPHSALQRPCPVDQRPRRHGADLRGFGPRKFQIRLRPRRQFESGFSGGPPHFRQAPPRLGQCRRLLSPLDFKNLASFEIGPPAVWNFVASAGDGRAVEIELRAEMLEGKNTTVFHFSRPGAGCATGKQLPAAADVRLTVRFDIEDRNFHWETRRNGGADFHFSSNTHVLPHHDITASRITPASPSRPRPPPASCLCRRWRLSSAAGMVREHSASGRTDARPDRQWRRLHPRWFELPLAKGANVTLVATAEGDAASERRPPARGEGE